MRSCDEAEDAVEQKAVQLHDIELRLACGDAGERGLDGVGFRLRAGSCRRG